MSALDARPRVSLVFPRALASVLAILHWILLLIPVIVGIPMLVITIPCGLICERLIQRGSECGSIRVDRIRARVARVIGGRSRHRRCRLPLA